jgi:hypothetical protein
MLQLCSCCNLSHALQLPRRLLNPDLTLDPSSELPAIYRWIPDGYQRRT